MSHKVLEVNGSVLSSEELSGISVIDSADPSAALADIDALASGQVALLKLPVSADGRAFSVLGHVKASNNTPRPIWLGGDLLPDQVTLAFQCGADAVVVSKANWEKRGETAWYAALNPLVTLGYRQSRCPQVADVSQLRS